MNIAKGLLAKLNNSDHDKIDTLKEMVGKAVSIDKDAFGFVVLMYKDKSVIRAPDIWSMSGVSLI